MAEVGVAEHGVGARGRVGHRHGPGPRPVRVGVHPQLHLLAAAAAGVVVVVVVGAVVAAAVVAVARVLEHGFELAWLGGAGGGGGGGGCEGDGVAGRGRGQGRLLGPVVAVAAAATAAPPAGVSIATVCSMTQHRVAATRKHSAVCK